MNDAKVYAPFRCVASFVDGSRLAFDGLTREQARAAMEAAMEQHGDYGPWNWVTDPVDERPGQRRKHGPLVLRHALDDLEQVFPVLHHRRKLVLGHFVHSSHNLYIEDN